MASTGIQLSYSCINEASNSHTFSQIVRRNSKLYIALAEEKKEFACGIGRLSVASHDSTSPIVFTLVSRPRDIDMRHLRRSGVNVAPLSLSAPDGLDCMREYMVFPKSPRRVSSAHAVLFYSACFTCLRGLDLPTRTSLTRMTSSRTRRNRQLTVFTRMR